MKIAETYQIQYQQIEDRMPRLERQEAYESDLIMKDLRSLERSVKRVQRRSQRQGDKSTASTSQRSSDISYRPREEVRQPSIDHRNQQERDLQHYERFERPVMEGSFVSDCEDDGLFIDLRSSRPSELQPNSLFSIDMYASSSEDDRERFFGAYQSEPGPSPQITRFDNAPDDSDTGQEAELIEGSRVIDDGTNSDSEEEMTETFPRQRLHMSMEVGLPGSIVSVKGPAESQSGRQRFLEARPDDLVCTSDELQCNTKGQSEINSERHSINEEQSSRTAGTVLNASKQPRNSDSTVERRHASRESDSWSRPDIASLASRISRSRNEGRRSAEVRDREDDVDEDMGEVSHREESKRRDRPSASHNNTRRECGLHEIREPVNDGAAVQIPRSRLGSFAKNCEGRESSKKPKGDGSTSERPRRNESNGSGSRRKASSWSEEHLPLVEPETEPTRKNRDSSRDQNMRESRNKAEKERINTQTPKHTTVEARAPFHDESIDYKRPKELKKLAERRKLDTRGVVTGDPEEDDEFKRKKRFCGGLRSLGN